MNDNLIGLLFVLFLTLWGFFVIWLMMGYPIYAILKHEKMELKKMEIRLEEKKLSERAKKMRKVCQKYEIKR